MNEVSVECRPTLARTVFVQKFGQYPADLRMDDHVDGISKRETPPFSDALFGIVICEPIIQDHMNRDLVPGFS
ncbi:hypothetical protein [Rhizobium leguminosarum]|uniref:hypothetical protein n=1 Tax=Rhizobium TaxID=379 RepID=UPI00103041C2|nr:hypothetical protein [Rhizobium leguminosarum]TBF81947.1 hypothetical protein ELG86_07275 [Rhizobium leguminosarum]TBH01437.1 hypothetical protein ELG70_07265 [Rhizobium leguminosarum]TBH10974.1 hypothetical protein ELG68_07325 [Rhizobium leguminosarum]TBH35717.1 hypothetical protein ELG66_07325 [Rhizobium leguminosarum]TBH66172.1 hypothetical protein ELG61_07280 [Rhizobium leguminosarum]